MTITITYPSGHIRTHRELPQHLINKLITQISELNEAEPLDFVKIVVES